MLFPSSVSSRLLVVTFSPRHRPRTSFLLLGVGINLTITGEHARSSALLLAAAALHLMITLFALA